MEQLTMFDIPQSTTPPRIITTTYYDERQLLNDLLTLHNGGRGVDLDATYSTGRFWEGLPFPRFTSDILPIASFQADARHIPLPSASLASVMFDPPFIVRQHHTTSSIIADRFSAFPSVQDLLRTYHHAIHEFSRILTPRGLLIFKCQDFTYRAQQCLTHLFIVTTAESAQLYTKDLFVLVRDQVIIDPRMRTQHHARKTHSYFLVLKKQPAPPPPHYLEPRA